MGITKFDEGQIIEKERDNIEFFYNLVHNWGGIRINGMQIHFDKMVVSDNKIRFYYHSDNVGIIWKDEKEKAYNLCEEIVKKESSTGNII